MGAVERVRGRVSFADLERAPEDGRRYELYDGEVSWSLPRFPCTRSCSTRVTELLRRALPPTRRVRGVSPIDIVFSEHDVLQPDVVFFGPARAHLIDLHTAIRYAPDLCVEILSPSTEATDRGRKLADVRPIRRAGVPGSSILSARPSRSTGSRRAATCSRSARQATMR